MTPINYECHITISYLTESERASLMTKLGLHSFRFAKLLFSKDAEFNLDIFMSAKDTDFSRLFKSMHSLLLDLQRLPHVRILRYKIEATLVDFNHCDILSLKAL